MRGVCAWYFCLTVFWASPVYAALFNDYPNFLYDVCSIVYDFNVNIISRDTLKVIAASAPLYFATRNLDKRVHNCFYCARHHKNINQLPDACYYVADIGLGAAMIGLSLFSLYPYDKRVSTTAQVFALSLPFVFLEKKILKKWKCDAGRRPRSEFFDRYKKYYGGCPSGHMMGAAYMTALFGMQLGAAWGVPLGLFSAGIFVEFAASNRHYVSQMIAGAALGVIFAFASKKVIDVRLNESFSWGVDSDCMGRPALKVEYSF
jgi:membrane-associated phospholipid phosphatase